MKIIIGPDAFNDDEKVVKGILGFICGALLIAERPV